MAGTGTLYAPFSRRYFVFRSLFSSLGFFAAWLQADRSLSRSLLMLRVLFYVLSSLVLLFLDVLLPLTFLLSSLQNVIFCPCHNPKLITQSECANSFHHFISLHPRKGRCTLRLSTLNNSALFSLNGCIDFAYKPFPKF